MRAGPPAEVLDPGRLVHPAAHRRAPRRPARLRGGRRRRVHARHPGAADLRRDHLRGPRGAALDRVLRARVVRQVHAVPRGHLLAGADRWSGWRRARAPRPTSTRCSTSATTSSAGRSARSATARPARSPRRSSTSGTSTSPTSTHGGCPFDPVASTLFARSGARHDDHPRDSRRDDRAARSPTRSPVTIDGIEISVPKGTLVIRAAELLGIQIPRFCDHPLLDPVGACRQCLVEVEGRRALPSRRPRAPPTVTDGMVVRTQLTSPVADKAQQGVMELLLINHPLDCPVCDKGGECPLQNQAMSNGRAETRFPETQADLRQADRHLRPGAARPRALRALRALHPVLRADRRRPVHRPVRARRAAAGRHRRGAARSSPTSPATPSRSARSAR